ncbi:MAG TPA: hypothetical protein VL358_03765 [Caulobacteraceae bacterium]|jgi:hypothetical protein|nr:hypothetical protein [Caulobacteraceae bacterium]
MSDAQVHFELFARRTPNAPWTLHLATENRARALEAAEEMLAEGRAAAVKVCKETLSPETREFKSVTILNKGASDTSKAKKAKDVDDTPLCVAPSDLYSVHARERIGRLLDGWLQRKRVTPFELLHRPDLVEQLDASGVEIQHALQKIAIPEAQSRGVSVHEMIRTFQKLVQRSVERLLKDGRREAFPDLNSSAFAVAANGLADDPDRSYLLGGGVAAYLAKGATWREKVGLILDLAEIAPEAGKPRALAFQVLEQPLGEMLGSRGGLADLLGPDLDLGGSIAALTRLAAGPEVAALSAFDPTIEKHIPRLDGHAARLAGWLERDVFEGVRSAIGKRILTELGGPRRLRPGDSEGEIAILRALAMALTASAGKLTSHDEVQAAFVERCKSLVTGDFVETYLAGRNSALAEAEALVRLAENMVGSANKRAAARWISAAVGALRFEKDLRNGPDTAAVKLSVLSDLQRAVRAAGLNEGDQEAAAAKIGEIGGLIESDTKLTVLLAKAEAPAPQKLMLLLKLACGETAPLGPAADRAKAEALKLLRAPETRQQLAADPASLERFRVLMQSAGLAA